MFDLGHLFNKNAIAQEFFGYPAEAQTYSYTLPINKSFVYMIATGAGGSGGNGFSGSAGTQRGGGGGGGSGSTISALFPRILLPNTVFVTTGCFATSIATTISVFGNTTNAAANILVAKNGFIGSAGAGSGSAAGGNGGATTTRTDCAFLQLAIRFTSTGGVAGATGGSTGSGSSIGALNSACIGIPGTGGAGVISTPAAGGTITGVLPTFPDISGAANTIGNSLNMRIRPLLKFTGGMGGGSSNGAAGQDGGSGYFGGGGGGGGGGITGGIGGLGGGGYVVIIAF
jgi:hypothetical protein